MIIMPSQYQSMEDMLWLLCQCLQARILLSKSFFKKFYHSPLGASLKKIIITKKFDELKSQECEHGKSHNKSLIP